MEAQKFVPIGYHHAVLECPGCKGQGSIEGVQCAACEGCGIRTVGCGGNVEKNPGDPAPYCLLCDTYIRPNEVTAR